MEKVTIIEYSLHMFIKMVQLIGLCIEVEADLILSVEKYRHKAEINMKTKGATLNTVEETGDMLSSLGLAFDHIEKRVKKSIDKTRRKKRRRGKEGRELLPEETESSEPRILRSQDFSMKPMSIDEALMQLDSKKRDVFVFRKFDTEKWAVLYRRKDGNIGLIEPE